MANGKMMDRQETTLARRARRTLDALRLHGGRSEGQTLALAALLLTVLLLFVGLGVDVGNLMAHRAKLQSAVDASALSAAQMLVADTGGTTRERAEQMMEANGIGLVSLAEPLTVEEFHALFQVRVAAVQSVNTYFMRLIPVFTTVTISAEATADLSSYAEINAKPYGQPGVVNEVNLMVWGWDSHRRHGDAYSPEFDSMTGRNNPLAGEMPYGYLFRIDVPADFPGNDLVIEAFDPDSYNRADAVPAWNTAIANTALGNATRPPDQFANCSAPGTSECNTSNANPQNPGLNLRIFQDNKHGFWRVDEYRYPYTGSTGADAPAYRSNHSTRTFFTLWHFDPRSTTAFADPEDLSDSGGPIGLYDIREYPDGFSASDITNGATHPTDLRWVEIIRVTNFRQRFQVEDNGNWYFYLYVQGQDGSSENNYDLRVGPPQALGCSNSLADHCYLNRLYRDFNYSSSFQTQLRANGYCVERVYPNEDGNTSCDNVSDEPLILWKDGGARIFAKRALPLNLLVGSRFPVYLTQVPREAAGQVLGVRHFDMDCSTSGNNICGTTTMNYQMEICNSPYSLEDSRSWRNISTGYVGGNNVWTYGSGPDPELVPIPDENSSLFNTLFGSGGTSCPTSWLRMESYPSSSNDTSVWEIPFIRPRLIR